MKKHFIIIYLRNNTTQFVEIEYSSFTEFLKYQPLPYDTKLYVDCECYEELHRFCERTGMEFREIRDFELV